MKEKNERLIDRCLSGQFNIGKITFRVVDLLFLVCIWILALAVRIRMIPIQSADFSGFLRPWMDQIREVGPLKSLGVGISNYAPSYMYLMALAAALSKNDLVILKAVSFFFDYAASVAVFLLVFRMTRSTGKAVASMALTLLSPTVIMDSAYWCQCDIIYTCFVLFGMCALVRKSSRGCLICIGLAFCFKLQAVFIFPLLLILWMKDYVVKLRHFIYVPLLFFLSVIPSWIAGQDLPVLLKTYFMQGNYYPWGTLEYPNMYVFLDETMSSTHYTSEVTGAGMFFFVAVMGILAYWLYRKEFKMNQDLVLTIAVLTVAVTVYTLPHMHDRYGFMIDLLAIPWCMLRPKRIPICFGFFLVSVLTFSKYLLAVYILPPVVVALMLLFLIGLVAADLWKQVNA